MRQSSFKRKFIGLSFLFIFIFSNFSSFAQTKRRVPVKKAATAQTQKAEVSGEILISEWNPALSGIWESGQLPPPLPLPAGNTDEVAASLAQKVAAKNVESVPAMLTALQLSGFFITNKDGSTYLAPPDGKGQGLTINGWEIASTAKMLGEGRQTTLKDLSETLKSINGFANANAGDKILNGLRQNADNAKNPFLRIWARFIIELGKNSATKYDIASGAKAENVMLDAVQNLLILRRLYGDVFALGEKYKTKTTRGSVQRDEQVQFVNASFSKQTNFSNSNYLTANFSNANYPDNIFDTSERNANLPAPVIADDKQIPCKMDGDAPIVMDTIATVSGIGFGELMGYLEEALPETAGDALGKYSSIVGIANIVLAYAKFLQTYAALETTLTLEDGAPLIRTKNSVPGARKNLRADVRFNIGNWQVYNCFRTAINLAGIDFATVNDGPAGGIGVTWHLDEGGGRSVYSNSTGITGNQQIVGLTQGGGRIQNAGTSAGVRGANAVGNATYTKTDGDGVARMILEGSPQKNAITGKAAPVMKQAKIRTTIKVKAGDLKGESVDVAGQVLGGLPGLITMPLELLYRMDWASTASLVVPVQDWEECEGGWSGTVTAVTKYYDEKPIAVGSEIRSEIHTVTVSTAGKLNPEGGFNNRYFADANAESRERNFKKEQYKKDSGFCGKGGPYFEGALTKTSEILRQANGTVKADLYISQSGSSGSLMFSTNEKITGVPVTYDHQYKGLCSLMNTANTKFTKGETYILTPRGFTVSFEIDLARPSEMSGSKTVDEGNGRTTTYTWNLRRCE